MNYLAYKTLFEEILSAETPASPYDKPDYLNYTKLNQSRMKRWDKHLVLSDSILSKLQEITSPQHWIIITEPWCGDAAHIVPFLIKITEQNPLLTYEIQLRDSEPFLIEKYLTNGTSKSIPKLIARDESGNDLFVWGPRPEGAHQLMEELKAENADFETVKIKLQNWYNDNKGEEICHELAQLIG